MRFDVPQFIDVEDKIFGPLTFRQFVYVVGGGGLCYIVIKTLPTYASLILVPAIGALSVVLAFIKFNGKPFINIIESAFTFGVRDKLYIWKKNKVSKDIKKTDANNQKNLHAYIPTMTESKLHDLSWGLDVLDSKGR
ncbi:MAG: PrgI family protein [Candidatus Pacebacteria bacterium]|nr:PrgI family protein [Candidatus Paceibacterota bacterium]